MKSFQETFIFPSILSHLVQRMWILPLPHTSVVQNKTQLGDLSDISGQIYERHLHLVAKDAEKYVVGF